MDRLRSLALLCIPQTWPWMTQDCNLFSLKVYEQKILKQLFNSICISPIDTIYPCSTAPISHPKSCKNDSLSSWRDQELCFKREQSTWQAGLELWQTTGAVFAIWPLHLGSVDQSDRCQYINTLIWNTWDKAVGLLSETTSKTPFHWETLSHSYPECNYYLTYCFPKVQFTFPPTCSNVVKLKLKELKNHVETKPCCREPAEPPHRSALGETVGSEPPWKVTSVATPGPHHSPSAGCFAKHSKS